MNNAYADKDHILAGPVDRLALLSWTNMDDGHEIQVFGDGNAHDMNQELIDEYEEAKPPRKRN